MATVQYNFKIEETLKEEIEKKLMQSGAENKAEFLQEVISSYIPTKSNIDMSKFDNVNKDSKEAIHKAFKHIIGLLDTNISYTKQEAIYIEIDKEKLTEEREAFVSNIEKINAEHKTELEKIQSENKEVLAITIGEKEELALQVKNFKKDSLKINTELNNAQKIAEQVNTVIEENKGLREVIKEGKTKENNLLKELNTINKAISKNKEDLIKAELTLANKDKEIAELKKSIDNNTKHLQEIKKEVSILEKNLIEKEFEKKSQNDTIFRIEKNNAELKKTINGLQTSHTKDIQIEKKKYDKDIAEVKKELDSTKQELYISIGKLEVLQEKETQKVTPTKKEEKKK